MDAAESEQCVVCDASAPRTCGRCCVARYCSREHQSKDWPTHRHKCFPCRLQFNEKLGRHLVASRHISAGETILSDPPLVVGPQYSTKPICLGCNGSVEGKYPCPDCGYPLCGPKCPNKINHQRECQLIQLRGKKANVTVVNDVNPIYQCITPLRCLWMRERAPPKWSALKGMEAHLPERKESGRWEEVQNFIVYIVRKFFDLDMFTEEDIQRVCGILETNGFEVPELNLVALYGFGYLLEHSCVPNTTRTFDARLNLVVAAAVDIKAGEHITTSYTNPFWGDRMRKVHLMKFKYFECSCLRCLDPTDLNTHLSSVKCGSCSKGLLPPPKDIISKWECKQCGESFDACDVEQKIVDIFKKKETLVATISSLEKFLKETRRSLSENHQYRIETKLALLQMYGRGEESEIDRLSDDQISRKQDLCNEVLQVMNLFAPGLSRIRGIILYELHSTFAEQFRRMHHKFKNTDKGEKAIGKAEETLTEALTILKLETHLKEEMQMATEAEIELDRIKRWKNQLMPKPLPQPSPQPKNKKKKNKNRKKNNASS